MNMRHKRPKFVVPQSPLQLCNWPELQSLSKFRLNVYLLPTEKRKTAKLNNWQAASLTFAARCRLPTVDCRLSLTAKYSVAKLTDVTAIHKMLCASRRSRLPCWLIQLLADLAQLVLLLTLYTITNIFLALVLVFCTHIRNTRNNAVGCCC